MHNSPFHAIAQAKKYYVMTKKLNMSQYSQQEQKRTKNINNPFQLFKWSIITNELFSLSNIIWLHNHYEHGGEWGKKLIASYEKL